jgi:hypothetical protein
MPNRKVKKIAIYISIFCAGTITGHFLSGLLFDSHKTSLYKTKDTNSPGIVNASNKMFPSITKDEIQNKPELRDQKIAYLRKKLDQMIKKAFLQEKYISILNDSLDKIMDGDIHRPIDEIISQKLDAMNLDDQEMLGLIQSFINIDPDDLPSQIPIKDFAVKLVEIAANGVLTPVQSKSNTNAPPPLPVYFDTSTNPDFSVSEPKETFLPEENKIFASFDSSQLTDENVLVDSVLVKWYRTDQPKILLMKSFPIRPLSNYNHIWLDRPHGWSRGDYQVEIYSFQDDTNLVASGKYNIE